MQKKYLSFEKTREYVRKQKLKNTKEWKKWSNGTLEGKDRRPDFIPSNPDIVYIFTGLGETALVLANTVISAPNLPTTARKATYVFTKGENGNWFCSIDNSYGHEIIGN